MTDGEKIQSLVDSTTFCIGILAGFLDSEDSAKLHPKLQNLMRSAHNKVVETLNNIDPAPPDLLKAMIFGMIDEKQVAKEPEEGVKK